MSSEKDANRPPYPFDRSDEPLIYTHGKESGDTNIVTVPVVRFSTLGSEETQQEVIQEAPVTIFINDKQVVTLLTIIHDLPALAVGFLFSEGWIADRSAITEIQVEQDQGVVRLSLKEIPAFTESLLEKRMIGSGCGKATSFYNVLDAIHCKPISSNFRVRSSEIAAWTRRLLSETPLYRQTRGTHAVALHAPSGMLFCEQDIGRHNAVDRILGKCLLERTPVQETVMLTTGRLSSDMVTKAARLGTPIVVSRSAPTSLALTLSERLKVTIVGCVKGERMNVYTHPDRILIP